MVTGSNRSVNVGYRAADFQKASVRSPLHCGRRAGPLPTDAASMCVSFANESIKHCGLSRPVFCGWVKSI
jgi:hypothetical protein